MRTRLIWLLALLVGFSLGAGLLVRRQASRFEVAPAQHTFAVPQSTFHRLHPSIHRASVLPGSPPVAGLLPGKPDPGTQPPPADEFHEAERVLVQDDPPNPAGEFKRVSILRTTLKYPLIRVEDQIVLEGHLNEERILRRRAMVADHVLVKAQPGVNANQLAAVAAKYGGGIRRLMRTPGLYLVTVPTTSAESLPQAIAGLNTERGVLQYAEPDEVVYALLTPNDPSFADLWGMDNTGQTGGTPDADVDAPEAWDRSTGGTNVVVGVIDSGIDYTHPDLAANIWTNPGEIPGNGMDDDGNGYVDDVRGWNFYGDNNNPRDDHFHGTHVAGAIGALGNNAVGVVGVAWQVRLLPLKFLSDTGSGYSSDAVEAITYATQMRVRLTSNSWGGGGYSQALKDAIDAAANAGILFVASAGNDSSDNDVSPAYPASYTSSNVIAVAATDHNDELALFSNYGAHSVHLAAPGVGILSAFPTNMTPEMARYGLTPNYGRLSGTSMATPYVAGVAALVAAQNPGLTLTEWRNRILLRSDKLARFAGVIQTAGRLNAFNAVNPGWQPPPPQLAMTGYTLGDSEGNNDGSPAPGEIVWITPELLNIGGQAATNVSVQLASQQAGATVLAPTNISVGIAQPFTPVSPATPFRVQLDAGLADNTELTFEATIRFSGGADVRAPFSLVVSRPNPHTEVALNFSCGEMKADPARNRIYLLNKTDLRVLAIDTDSGQVTAMAALDGSPEIAPPVENGSLRSGQLAVSLDDRRLYVALTADRKIQVFELPDLTPVTTFPVDFAPESLACGVNGRLYASSTDYWGPIREVNANNGQVIQTFDGGRQFYMHALLRASRDGARLYVGETGLRVEGGPAYVYEYNIGGATATLVNRHPLWMVYLKDFGVDELKRRLYTLHGGIYGVELTDLDTGQFGEVWSFDSAYSAGVAFLPYDPVIYGASGDLYAGNIRKFRRTDGLKLDDYFVATNGIPISPRGLTITPNGNLLYIRGGSILGIVGLSSLNITNPPIPPGAANLVLTTVNFSDTEGNGDSVPNAGEIIRLTPVVRNTGVRLATNATIELAAGAGATNLSAALQTLGDIGGGVTTNAAGYRIQLNGNLPTDSVVPFTFTTRWNTGQVKTCTYALVIRGMQVINEVASKLQFGEILADQRRNTVYLLDKRYRRLLAFDTNGGHLTTATPLANPGEFSGYPPEPGMLAESVDGTVLYVALKKAKKIQAFALPDLTAIHTWSYDFEPVSLACNAAGRLYATTTVATQKLVQIDLATGQVLSRSGTYFDSNSVLRRNAAGTELYGSLGATIFRFDTTGPGAPTLMGTLSVAGSGTIRDFAFDADNARFYAILGDGKVTVAPLDGSPVTTWPLNASWGAAVTFLPDDDEVMGASDDSYGGGIRRFARATGAPLQDYVVSNNGDGIMPRGMAITPNGRILYVKRKWNGSSGASTVDGYDYWIGMIGGTVDLDIPGKEPVVLKSLTLTDPLPGNHDGYANPGETVQLSPTFKNLCDYQLSNVIVEALSSDPLAVVQSPVTRSIGNVNGYVSFTPAPNFSLQLSPSLTDEHEVKLMFRVTHDTDVQQLIPYSLFIAQPIKAEATIGFTMGEMLADRTRNLAYVLDRTNPRLLAIDTAAGTVAAAAKLAADPGTGRMALAPDGSRLYVALTTTNKIQVFNLPALEQADLFGVDFSPVGLAAASDGKLYASSTATWQYLWQIDPATGAVLGHFGRRIYYGSSVLRLDGAGMALFVAEIGLSGIGELDEYTIGAAGVPVFKKWHPFNLSNTKDFGVDDLCRRLYTMSGGVYGIGVTEMDTGVGNIVWPFGAPYGSALAFLPGDTFIHGGSYFDGIFRFNRADGRRVAAIPIGGGQLMDRAMAITANGRIVYAKNGVLGLIGRASLTINSPNLAPHINLGSDQTTRVSRGAMLRATLADDDPVGVLTTVWAFVSGPEGAIVAPQSATNAAASFAAPGAYRLRATVSDGARRSSDEITIAVLPDLPAVSVGATVPVATRSGPVPGELTFTRTQLPTDVLNVNYTVTGTATGGVDYAALSGHIAIPDGAASATLTVMPTLNGPGFDAGKTVIVTVSANANYDVGVSRQAVVMLKEHDYDTWRTLKLSGAPAADQLYSADPDHDGLANLMEYALGAEPLQAEFFSWLVPGISDLIGEHRYFTLTYTRPRGMTDVSYAVEVSGDLARWNSGDGYTVLSSVQPLGNGLEQVVARDAVPLSTPGLKAHFLRLKITQP